MGGEMTGLRARVLCAIGWHTYQKKLPFLDRLFKRDFCVRCGHMKWEAWDLP
jgi:hypothetical protein